MRDDGNVMRLETTGGAVTAPRVALGTNALPPLRLMQHNRILWGGYDAIYHYGNKVQARLTQRPETRPSSCGQP